MTTIATTSASATSDLLDLVEATIDAQRIVDGLQGELATAERAHKEAEAALTLSLLLNPEGPVNGKNESIRQAQLTEWLAFDPGASNYREHRRLIDDQRRQLREAQTLAESHRLALSVRREMIRHETARLMAGVS